MVRSPRPDGPVARGSGTGTYPRERERGIVSPLVRPRPHEPRVRAAGAEDAGRPARLRGLGRGGRRRRRSRRDRGAPERRRARLAQRRARGRRGAVHDPRRGDRDRGDRSRHGEGPRGAPRPRRDRPAAARLLPRPRPLPRQPDVEGHGPGPRAPGRVARARALPRGGGVVKHGEFLTGDRARDQRNVNMLLEAVEQLTARTDLRSLVRSAVDSAIQVTGAQRGVLLLADESDQLGVRVARHREGRDLPLDLRYSRSVANKVWTTGKPHLAVDADASGALALGRSILDLRLLSILAVPLPVKDKKIGVLYVDSTATVKEFTEGDRAVFEALAGIAATAIEQTRLAEQEAERKRLQSEVDVARNIQLSLMPKDVPAPAGWDVAFQGRAAGET